MTPWLQAIESRLGSRPLVQWLVTGSDATLLVDTGIHGTVTDQITPALADLGVTPERIAEVMITHADVDHYGGNAEIRELAPAARLRAHPADRPAIESWEVIARERYGWYRPHGLDYDADTWSWLAEAAGPDTPLDGDLLPGERIDLGGPALEVLHLPGHSLGHIGLHEPGTRTAIVGDAVMGWGFNSVGGGRAGPPPYVDVAAYRSTVAQLRDLAPARLATAHFPLLEGEAVRDFLDLSERFVDELDRLVDAEPGKGSSVAELLGPVAAALGGFPEMEVELARSIGAHLEARG